MIELDTALLPQNDQFEAWRQLNRAAIDLSLTKVAGQPFLANMKLWNLGGMIYTHAQMPSGILREWSHWRHRPLDHWCLVIADPERLGDRRRIIGLRSLAEPFQGTASDSNVHTLYIPRWLFGGRASALDHVPADIVDAGLGALLADYLLRVFTRLPQLTAAELPRVVEATRMMILACTEPSRDRTQVAKTVFMEAMSERARQLVEQNLLSPTLDVSLMVAKLGLSRSKLYRLFEQEGGVEQFIRRRRLQHAHTVLSDPNITHNLQAIGEARGFQDAASFSRAFRREFGYSPTDARAVAKQQAAALNRPIHKDFQVLGTLLRSL